MANLKIGRIMLGMCQTNCYFVYEEGKHKALVFDPADKGEYIYNGLRDKGFSVEAILLTHGHFDHAMAAGKIAEEFQIPVYAEEHEKETLKNPAVNLSGRIGKRESYHADEFVKDGDVLSLAGFTIKVLFTPGHTQGGCCFYFEEEQALFSGDTLFHDSVGRTDFPGGSASVLLKSIEDKLMPLPGQVNVYPGHNDTTTIGWERQYNPFL